MGLKMIQKKMIHAGHLIVNTNFLVMFKITGFFLGKEIKFSSLSSIVKVQVNIMVFGALTKSYSVISGTLINLNLRSQSMLFFFLDD